MRNGQPSATSAPQIDRSAEILQYEEGIRQALAAAAEAEAAFLPARAAEWRALAKQMAVTRDVYAGRAGLVAA